MRKASVSIGLKSKILGTVAPTFESFNLIVSVRPTHIGTYFQMR